MSVATQYDAGQTIKVMPALPATTVPSSSGAATNGLTIDRLALGRRYYSCRAAVAGRLTGSTQQTVGIGVSFEHSSDGSSWDAYSTDTNPDTVTAGSTGATGAQSTDGIVEQPVNLNGARRYVRLVAAAPSFALTTSGDNVVLTGVIAFAGADELPSA